MTRNSTPMIIVCSLHAKALNKTTLPSGNDRCSQSTYSEKSYQFLLCCHSSCQGSITQFVWRYGDATRRDFFLEQHLHARQKEIHQNQVGVRGMHLHVSLDTTMYMLPKLMWFLIHVSVCVCKSYWTCACIRYKKQETTQCEY